MATRMRFLPSAGVPASALAFHSHWDATTSAVRRQLDTDGVAEGIGGTQTSFGLAETTSARQSKLLIQFQSRPLLAQTISGTLKGQMQAMESNVAMDAALQVHVRVADPVAGTTRGVLWAPDTTFTTMGAAGSESYELDTTKTNRKAPAGWSGSGHSLSSVAALDGDILVVEVGVRHCNTVTTSYTGTIYFCGQGYSADLPEDETETATGTAWIEFSHNFSFFGVSVQEPSHVLLSKLPVFPALSKPPVAVGQLWPRGAGRQ